MANKPQTKMKELIQQFAPITLAEMSGIRLLNRTDTKFVTSLPLLRELLTLAKDDYYVQEIDGERIAPYYTVYFDTPEHDMYMLHQNGHAFREKLRIRSYVDSNLNFLEVKVKNNHGRTIKSRLKADDFDPKHPDYDILRKHLQEKDDQWISFLRQHLHFDPKRLGEQLENHFDRITLVNKQKTERLTIDMNLRLDNLETGRNVTFSNVVIIELKRDGLKPSPILNYLRLLRIHPLSFSKYTIGTAMTNDAVKHNRLKPRIRRICKIEQQ